MRLLAVALLLLTVAVPFAEGQGGSVERLPSTLPGGREAPAAATDGHHVWVFGGYDGHETTDDIVQFDPADGSAILLPVRLPTPRHGAAAVWFDGAAYVIGGYGCREIATGPHFCDSVVKFEPGTNKVTTMHVQLPMANGYQAAATDGKAIYIFGGANNTYEYKGVWKYDPRADEVLITGARYPTGRTQMSAVWDGRQFFTFGGQTICAGKPCSSAEIWRYDPTKPFDRALVQANGTLPRRNQGSSAFWDGRAAYVVAGQDYPFELDTVVRYDTASGAVTLLGARLPSGRFKAALAWTGTDAYLFGGEIQDDHLNDANSVRLDEIVRFTPAVASTEPTRPIAGTDAGQLHKAPGVEAVGLLALLGASAALGRRRAH